MIFFTAKETGKATGMGLSVLRGIVKSHKGAVAVRSEPGKGTTFEVFLPAGQNIAKITTDDGDELPTGNFTMVLKNRKRLSERNLTRINEFAASCSALICDTGTSRHYGETKNILRAKGRPIPENDIWIAAIAKQHKLTLVSRDNHFKEIEDFLALTG